MTIPCWHELLHIFVCPLHSGWECGVSLGFHEVSWPPVFFHRVLIELHLLKGHHLPLGLWPGVFPQTSKDHQLSLHTLDIVSESLGATLEQWF